MYMLNELVLNELQFISARRQINNYATCGASFIGYRLCRRPLGPDVRMLVFLRAWWPQICDEFESHFEGFWPPLVFAARPQCHLGSTGVSRVPK